MAAGALCMGGGWAPAPWNAHCTSARAKLAGRVSETCRQILLRRHQNFPDRAPILGREMRELLRPILAAQHLVQALIERALCLRGQGVERLAVDQVTAGVFEHPRFQVQLPKRSAVTACWSASREL